MADKTIPALTNATLPLTGTERVHIEQGGNSRDVALSDVVALSTGAMLKSTYDPNDDGIISVANGGTNSATASGARTNLGLGTMAVQNAATAAITGGTITGITDLAIADGGTGASTAATARANLDLEPGVDVQAYLGAGVDGNVLKWQAGNPVWGTVAGTGDMVGASNLSELTNIATARVNLGLPGGASTVLVRNDANTLYEAVALGTNGGRKLRNRVVSEVNLWDFLEDDPDVPGAVNAAFTAAQAALGRSGAVLVPDAIYAPIAPFVIRQDIQMQVICDRGIGPAFIADASFTPGEPMVKQLNSAAFISHFKWTGGYFDGSGIATQAIKLDLAEHYDLYGLTISGTLNEAIRAHGYSASITRCRIVDNAGGGLTLVGYDGSIPYQNNIAINETRIWGNDGIGARVGEGLQVSFNACGIEANKVTGLVAHAMKSLKVSGCYFEQNAENGYAFTTAGGSDENLTVKADIMLLNQGLGIWQSLPGEGVTGAVIDGCEFQPRTGNDCFVFATSLENSRISNNVQFGAVVLDGLVGTFNRASRTTMAKTIIEGNTRNDVALLGTGSTTEVISTAHEISNRFTDNAHNYAKTFVADAAILSGTTGALSGVGANFKGFPVYEVTSGDKIYGVTLDLVSAFPELVGQLMWFGIACRVREANSGIRLYINGQMDVTGDSEAVGGWKVKSVVRLVTGTSLTIAIQSMGTVTNAPYFAIPRLGVVGNSATDLMRV